MKLCSPAGRVRRFPEIAKGVRRDLHGALLNFRFGPYPDPQLFPDQLELRLPPRQQPRQADDQARDAGADGAHIARLRQQRRQSPVALGMHAQPEIVRRHRIRQPPRTAHLHPVREHEQPDLRAAQAVVPVGDGVDHRLAQRLAVVQQDVLAPESQLPRRPADVALQKQPGILDDPRNGS